ncbi:MAG TPA: hypothetical protein PKA91_12810, partial [Leptospiraceae bacterium]|nr:hypothetical protein [Leptospiraceae bacterium]
MDDPGRLTLAERYRQGIESLIHFDFERREEDLKWMLAESKKPVKGISWLKEKYYELLRKCEEHPVPFQLIYDLETIASRLFPRAARKFSFIKDPIPEYYRARLKIYEPELREIADSEGHIRGADLLGVLGKMGARDGRSMVEMFLARLKDGKSHSSLASKLEPGALEQLE